MCGSLFFWSKGAFTTFVYEALNCRFAWSSHCDSSDQNAWHTLLRSPCKGQPKLSIPNSIANCANSILPILCQHPPHAPVVLHTSPLLGTVHNLAFLRPTWRRRGELVLQPSSTCLRGLTLGSYSHADWRQHHQAPHLMAGNCRVEAIPKVHAKACFVNMAKYC